LNDHKANDAKDAHADDDKIESKSETSSSLDRNLDRKIEEALDDEIKQDPGIVDKFKNLDDLKTYIIDK